MHMMAGISPRGPALWAIFSTVLALVVPIGAGAQPNVSASFTGPVEAVFDSLTQACERFDIPDQGARAFRDYHGNVHLIASHYIVRAMVGPSLDTVRRDCRVIYRSPQEANPADFQDRNWFNAFYTTDGRRILALLHSEYHSEAHAGMCRKVLDATMPDSARCHRVSITMGESDDGGYSFSVPRPPGNLVATLPYQYSPAIEKGPSGYHEATNIVPYQGYVYAMFDAWAYEAQKFGACPIRTNTPVDPRSWRGWDGSGFSLRFRNPYVTAIAHPEQNVCAPVGSNLYTPDGIYIYGPRPIFIAMQSPTDQRFGPPSVYLSASTDLVTWSKRALLASRDSMLSHEQSGQWKYGYFALLDPNASDREVANVANTPYLYYVRFDLVRGNLVRTLMRQQIRLQIGG
jgi:hypothetical protein